VTRILLQFAGGELTLHQYRIEVPTHQAMKKAAILASGYFRSWDWSPDGEIAAIESHDSDCLMLIVGGKSAQDIFL
jgi:hypothetical protein